jgi:hypothetical protein
MRRKVREAPGRRRGIEEASRAKAILCPQSGDFGRITGWERETVLMN